MIIGGMDSRYFYGVDDNELSGFTIYEHLTSRYKTKNKEIPHINLDSQIQNICPTCLCDFILFDSKLYIWRSLNDVFNPFNSQVDAEKKFTLLQDNIRTIGGSDSLGYYITLDRNLYYIKAYYGAQKFVHKFISHYVKVACIENHAKYYEYDMTDVGQTIHFVTFDNQQLSFTSDEVILPSNYNMVKKSLFTHIYSNQKVLLMSLVVIRII